MPLHRVRPSALPERILIYGDPKTGKSRLSTSLPDSFGNIGYFAADPGSESLNSILGAYRSRITVIKPGPAAPTDKYDPDQDAFAFALHDWRSEGMGTLVWDTLTATSLEILNHLADSGAFSEKRHISIGNPKLPQNIPMQGDYMAAQNRISRLVEFLFRQPLHLIVICHATYDETRDGQAPEFGPATTGKATVRTFPGKFDSVLHIARKVTPAANNASVSKYTVFTERHSIYSAGVRSSLLTNPMPIVELDPDPVSFWHRFLSSFRKEQQ